LTWTILIGCLALTVSAGSTTRCTPYKTGWRNTTWNNGDLYICKIRERKTLDYNMAQYYTNFLELLLPTKLHLLQYTVNNIQYLQFSSSKCAVKVSKPVSTFYTVLSTSISIYCFHRGSQILMSDVPELLSSNGPCVGIITDDGQQGIINKYGYVFNLETNSWKKKNYPIYDPLKNSVDNMFTFRQRPTNFGVYECFDEGNCDRKKVGI
jgi:hypothetical protein